MSHLTNIEFTHLFVKIKLILNELELPNFEIFMRHSRKKIWLIYPSTRSEGINRDDVVLSEKNWLVKP